MSPDHHLVDFEEIWALVAGAIMLCGNRASHTRLRERAQKIKTRQTVTYAGDTMRTAN